MFFALAVKAKQKVCLLSAMPYSENNAELAVIYTLKHLNIYSILQNE